MLSALLAVPRAAADRDLLPQEPRRLQRVRAEARPGDARARPGEGRLPHRLHRQVAPRLRAVPRGEAARLRLSRRLQRGGRLLQEPVPRERTRPRPVRLLVPGRGNVARHKIHGEAQSRSLRLSLRPDGRLGAAALALRPVPPGVRHLRPDGGGRPRQRARADAGLRQEGARAVLRLHRRPRRPDGSASGVAGGDGPRRGHRRCLHLRPRRPPLEPRLRQALGLVAAHVHARLQGDAL